jgi:hypothetical protein
VFWSDFLSSFSSRVLASAIFPTRVDLFLQGDDSAGQPMGSYADSCRAALLQGIDLVRQSSDVGEFNESRPFAPSPLEFRKSAYEGGEAGFMVLTVEPGPVPSSKGSFHWKFKKAAMMAGLEAHAPDDLPVSGTRLIFQEEVIFE